VPDLPEGFHWPRLSEALKSDPSALPRKNEPLWFLSQIDLWDNIKAPVAEVQGLEATWGPTPVYRMLGHPEFLQSSGLAEGEQLLLQVSSDCQAGITEVGPYPETGMRWGATP
jgi:hypothetical protein